MLKQIIKNICDTVGIDAKRRSAIRRFLHGDKKIIYAVNNKQHNKRCLFIYITVPFTQKNIPLYHQNVWQAREWVKIFDEFGYTVDVADYREKDIKLKYSYDVCFGIIPLQNNYYLQYLNPNAKLITYLTGSNPIYTTQQISLRVASLKQRRQAISRMGGGYNFN